MGAGGVKYTSIKGKRAEMMGKKRKRKNKKKRAARCIERYARGVKYSVFLRKFILNFSLSRWRATARETIYGGFMRAPARPYAPLAISFHSLYLPRGGRRSIKPPLALCAGNNGF